MIMNWWISIALVAGIVGVGAILVYSLGASAVNIASLIIGLLWGFIVPRILDRGFRNEIMFKNKLYKLMRLRPANIIGFPDSVDDGIMYYKTRPQLPLKEFLSKIDERMEMLALSFTVIVQNIDSIRPIIASGKKITFLVLDPGSDYVRLHAQLYSDGANLDTQIETSLGALLRLRDDYPDNVTIMTYNGLAPWAITIIDGNIIKVEDRLIGRDSNSRPSHLTYKSNNEPFFDIYQREYNRILNLASDYRPP